MANSTADGMMAALRMIGMLEAMEKKCSDNVKFETESAALDHARKLACLRAGDSVMTKADGQESRKGIFAGKVDEGKRAMVFFCGDDGELRCGAFPWGCIRFPV